MPNPGKTFYVTTPIYYVNDRPHIGHVYTTTLGDVLARYHRLRGDEVFFLTGTDEHAAKVVDAAEERGLTAQAWADQNAAEFEQTFAKLSMTHDDFIRTSQDRHKSRVTQYVKALLDSGDVYLGDYEGWYDAGQEEYIPDNKAQEYDFKSPFNGKPLIRKTEKNYFFRLKEYRQALLDYIEANPGFVQPDSRRNEIIARIADAEDTPISRTGANDWCIRVPGDEDHGIYVWIDALFNYLTTVDTDDRRKFWPCNVHLIAKDILWFHGCIWPAMLMALKKQPGYDWVELPTQVYTHSFWISEGRKMSKTLGNFIDLETIDQYVDQFSLDALRWYLSTQGPLGSTDSDFAKSKFIEVYNSDLANTVGNCASRVTNMIVRYFDGVLPSPGREDQLAKSLRASAEGMYNNVNAMYEKTAIGAANEAALEVVRAIDNYIEQTQPFKLAKDDGQREKLGAILYQCAEALRIASLGLYPTMPLKIQELWKMIDCQYDVENGDLQAWTKWGGLKPGATITKGAVLFPRVQKD